METKDIGKRIYELRNKKGYSREYLSESAGISAKFLYEIELKGKGFSAKTLGKLSLALNTSADYILFGKEAVNYNLDLSDLPEKPSAQTTELLNQLLEIACQLARTDL